MTVNLEGVVTSLVLFTFLFAAVLVVIGLLGKSIPERVLRWILGAYAIVLVGHLLGAWTTYSLPTEFRWPAWFEWQSYSFQIGFWVDRTSLIYVSLAVWIYVTILRFSVRAFHRDTRQTRFYAVTATLIASILLIAVAGNFDTLALGWELTGLCSVLLISFFETQERSVQNSLRALTFYRICDMGMLAAVTWLHHYSHSADLIGLNRDLIHHPAHATFIAFLILFASLAKSAQFPMSSWLPRAMEGPTASSAMFYGAISIHLGPLLLLKTMHFWSELTWFRWAMGAMGLFGAFHAALIGRTRSDAKTALGYATIAQVSLMYVELAAGFPQLALFHLVGNALYRTWQFLRSSSILQDFQDNPAAFLEVRLRRKLAVENKLLSPSAQKKLFLWAFHGLHWDGWLYHWIQRPFYTWVGKLSLGETGVHPSATRVYSASNTRQSSMLFSAFFAVFSVLVVLVPTQSVFLILFWGCYWLTLALWTRPDRMGWLGLLLPLLTGTACWLNLNHSRDLWMSLTLLVSLGAVPFHFITQRIKTRLSPGMATLVFISQPALLWLSHFPSFQSATFQRTMIFLLLLNALYRASILLVRTDALLALWNLFFAQSSALLAGMIAGGVGTRGALFLGGSLLIAFPWLVYIVSIIESRARSPLQLESYLGWGIQFPGFKRLFLSLGLALIGTPGWLVFLAEDMLFHSFLELSPEDTLLYLLTVCLIGIGFYRVYAQIFLGPARPWQVRLSVDSGEATQ